jgi:DNA-binding protein H-NS
MPKTKSYDQIRKQIAALEAEAERARSKEIGEVVSKIRTAIEHYKLTAADLGLAVRAKPGPKPGTVRSKTRKATGGKRSGAAKYRNDAGQTWVGLGKRPQWLRDALAAGKQLSDFAVK